MRSTQLHGTICDGMMPAAPAKEYTLAAALAFSSVVLAVVARSFNCAKASARRGMFARLSLSTKSSVISPDDRFSCFTDTAAKLLWSGMTTSSRTKRFNSANCGCSASLITEFDLSFLYETIRSTTLCAVVSYRLNLGFQFLSCLSAEELRGVSIDCRVHVSFA